MDTGGAVATIDDRATDAGLAVLADGGGAVDAAIAANAVLAVVAPHLCGLGGDLFALVHTRRSVRALNASGRAGHGATEAADALRAEGHATMPFRHDVRTVTMPGCVDGWLALHEGYGVLPLEHVLSAAVDLAESGTPVSASLAAALDSLDTRGASAFADLKTQASARPGRVRRQRVASVLRAVGREGRGGFYEGPFGRGLLELGAGLFTTADLSEPSAEWVDPIGVDVWRHRVHTVPPNSQGYVTLGAAAIAATHGLVDDVADPQWAHVLVEASIIAGRDRPTVLHDRADGRSLLDAVAGRAPLLDARRASALGRRTTEADTTYLCAVDRTGVGVSLIQSNGGGFGSWLVEPNTGINLHNRGVGFSLDPSHPAVLAAGRRPPHTLAPVLVTGSAGELAAVAGSAGGDAQPQIVLQLLARLLHHGQAVVDAVAAPRWVLRSGPTGFDTWTDPSATAVVVEATAPPTWIPGLDALGHRVRPAAAGDGTFGHAHAITVAPDGEIAAASEPRVR